MYIQIRLIMKLFWL